MQPSTMLGRGIALVAALVVFAVPVTAASAAPNPPGTRDVLYVGNNWDGTADVVDPQRGRALLLRVLQRRDAVSAISYDTEQEVARIPAGDHPQRMRTGMLQAGLLGTKKR